MKHTVIYLFTIISLFLLTTNSAFAQPQRVPAYRGVLIHVQPDGDTLHYYLRGDEWHHYSITLDGYEIKENKKGKLCYVRLKRNGETVITNRQAKDIDKRRKCEQRWLNKHGNKLPK